MKKLLGIKKVAAMTGALTLSFSAISYAGQWKEDVHGHWWQEEDGSYPTNTWRWIDGNQDGISKCYYFDENGYCLTNTVTPDGYQVNENGEWILNGSVQTKKNMEVAMQKALNYYHSLYPDADGNHVIFDEETVIQDGYYIFTVRWQMSDKEAMRRMREGETVAANIFAGEVYYNIRTGEMRLE